MRKKTSSPNPVWIILCDFLSVILIYYSYTTRNETSRIAVAAGYQKLTDNFFVSIHKGNSA